MTKKESQYVSLASVCHLIEPGSWGATYLFYRADNGGPGTYSQLLILREYMSRLADDLEVVEEDIYPADYFDMIGGVGFGG